MIALILFWAFAAAAALFYVLTPRRPDGADEPHGAAYYARARYLRERGAP